MQGAAPSPRRPPTLPTGEPVLRLQLQRVGDVRVAAKETTPWHCKREASASACGGITLQVRRFRVRSVEGSVGAAQAFCSTVRWEIMPYSEVTGDFAGNANGTTAGIKPIVILGADNGPNWCSHTVAKHLQLMVGGQHFT